MSFTDLFLAAIFWDLNRPWFSRHFVAEKGVVAQISCKSTASPAPSDRYTQGCLTGRPRLFSLFIGKRP